MNNKNDVEEIVILNEEQALEFMSSDEINAIKEYTKTNVSALKKLVEDLRSGEGFTEESAKVFVACVVSNMRAACDIGSCGIADNFKYLRALVAKTVQDEFEIFAKRVKTQSSNTLH